MIFKPNSCVKTIRLDQNALVRGADGMLYPYAVWNKLMQAGKHSFKLLDGKNPSAPIFLIYELSQQEIESRLERMPKPMDSAAFTEGDTFNYFSFRDTDNKKYKKRIWWAKSWTLISGSLTVRLADKKYRI